MTGREMIIYIMQNNLEDEVVLKDGFFVGFMNEEEAAVKLGVGVETVKAWYSLKWLDGIQVGEKLYFRKDISNPWKAGIYRER